jgi:hypothetical protein
VILDVTGCGVVLAEIRPPAARAKLPVVSGAAVADEIAKAVDAGAGPGEVRDMVVAKDFARLEPGRCVNVAQVVKDVAGFGGVRFIVFTSTRSTASTALLMLQIVFKGWLPSVLMIPHVPCVIERWLAGGVFDPPDAFCEDDLTRKRGTIRE